MQWLVVDLVWESIEPAICGACMAMTSCGLWGDWAGGRGEAR